MVGRAARELLPVDLAVAADLGDQPLRERVHDGDADPVQAAGDLVALAAELAAGVELRQDDRERGKALVLHDAHRDARAPVADGDGVVRVEAHLDALVAPRERLVDRVVDHLVDEMVEPAGARRADVHPRAQADRLEAFENGDVFGVVTGLCHKKIPAQKGFLSESQSIRTTGRPGALPHPPDWPPPPCATASRRPRLAMPAAIVSRRRDRPAADGVGTVSFRSLDRLGARAPEGGPPRSEAGRARLVQKLARAGPRIVSSRWVSSNAHALELVAT